MRFRQKTHPTNIAIGGQRVSYMDLRPTAGELSRGDMDNEMVKLIKATLQRMPSTKLQVGYMYQPIGKPRVGAWLTLADVQRSGAISSNKIREFLPVPIGNPDTNDTFEDDGTKRDYVAKWYEEISRAWIAFRRN